MKSSFLSQLLMDPMVLSVLYVWCQLNRDMVVSFWFGTRFKALYLPWVLFGFNFILGSGYDFLSGNIIYGKILSMNRGIKSNKKQSKIKFENDSSFIKLSLDRLID